MARKFLTVLVQWNKYLAKLEKFWELKGVNSYYLKTLVFKKKNPESYVMEPTYLFQKLNVIGQVNV